MCRFVSCAALWVCRFVRWVMFFAVLCVCRFVLCCFVCASKKALVSSTKKKKYKKRYCFQFIILINFKYLFLEVIWTTFTDVFDVMPTVSYEMAALCKNHYTTRIELHAGKKCVFLFFRGGAFKKAIEHAIEELLLRVHFFYFTWQHGWRKLCLPRDNPAEG